jgi:prepilin-type N-terminal cleavage/methylation domain-containing protein
MSRLQKEHPRQSTAEQGFSLVELMVALMILVVGILGVGQIFAVSSRSAAAARTETAAVSLAREIEEKILSEDVDQVATIFDGVDTSVPGTITLPCAVWAAHLASQLGPNGRGRITVFDSVTDPSLLPGMYSVLVQVSWLAQGETLTVPLRFAITDIGS